MKFQHYDEAQKSAAAINDELRFLTMFGEMRFPAKCFIRSVMRRGTTHHSLGEWLHTAACMVPRLAKVTYLSPRSQLGMDALAVLKLSYPNMEVRKKEEEGAARNGSRPPKKASSDI